MSRQNQNVEFVDDNPVYGIATENVYYGDAPANQIVDHNNDYYFAEDDVANYEETAIVNYNAEYGKAGDEE